MTLLLLKIWIAWHLILGVVAMLERLPAWIWIAAGCMRGREALRQRLWVDFVRADGWVGYFYDQAKGRLFISLCPFVVLRLDFSKGEPVDALDRLVRAIEESQRAHKLTPAAFTRELLSYAGTAPRQSAIIEEAAARLRADRFTTAPE